MRHMKQNRKAGLEAEKPISIRNVDPDTWQKFRQKAKAQRENPGLLVTELLQLYLNNQIKINRQVLITSNPETSS